MDLEFFMCCHVFGVNENVKAHNNTEINNSNSIIFSLVLVYAYELI